jgi:hypothetical protein
VLWGRNFGPLATLQSTRLVPCITNKIINFQTGTKPYEIVQATKVRKGLKPGNPDLASYLDKL